MIEIEILSADDNLFSHFKSLYINSFPIFEQRTEAQQNRAFLQPEYHLAGYMEEDQGVGFISYWGLIRIFILSILQSIICCVARATEVGC